MHGFKLFEHHLSGGAEGCHGWNARSSFPIAGGELKLGRWGALGEAGEVYIGWWGGFWV